MIYSGDPIWYLDGEARFLFPLVTVLPLVLFWSIGRRAWSSRTPSRTARIGLVCGAVSLVGLMAFFLSLPLALGGLAVTLGLEGRAGDGGARLATAAVVLGSLGIVGGASVWLFAGSL